MIAVENIFDKVARSYDKTEEIRFKEYTDITLENTRKYLKPDYTVLDFGCATGTKAISLSGEVKQIVAIDISSKMVSLARQKAFEQNIANIQFIHGTIFDENLNMAYYDAVLVFNIIHLLENERKVLDRIAGLLKPGGLLISTTPCLAEKMNLTQKLKFLPFQFLKWIKILPQIKSYKFSDLEYLMQDKHWKLVEARKYFFELSSFYIVAKKV